MSVAVAVNSYRKIQVAVTVRAICMLGEQPVFYKIFIHYLYLKTSTVNQIVEFWKVEKYIL